MPLIRKCRICASPFTAKPVHVRNGGGIYCSKTCHYKGIKTGKDVICSSCGIQTYKPKARLKKSKSKKYFCSKSCQTRWRNALYVGKKHKNWKDGMYAYRTVLLRHRVPQECTLCHTIDKRVLAVHHIDHDRKNNKRRNLAWLCHNCHHLVHHDKLERQRFKKSL